MTIVTLAKRAISNVSNVASANETAIKIVASGIGITVMNI